MLIIPGGLSAVRGPRRVCRCRPFFPAVPIPRGAADSCPFSSSSEEEKTLSPGAHGVYMFGISEMQRQWWNRRYELGALGPLLGISLGTWINYRQKKWHLTPLNLWLVWLWFPDAQTWRTWLEEEGSFSIFTSESEIMFMSFSFHLDYLYPPHRWDVHGQPHVLLLCH